ncbi:hypothetical protein PR048_020553 [Dryococelus australis]|uniref:Uncharacterized protein n=1 Tax=Dryococelus australis TaxID=614101 RepID=A0ABQ9H6K9_9NEOP|nr:hypothetical protein PR048_020553 [Dryococelus australis]
MPPNYARMECKSMKLGIQDGCWEREGKKGNTEGKREIPAAVKGYQDSSFRFLVDLDLSEPHDLNSLVHYVVPPSYYTTSSQRDSVRLIEESWCTIQAIFITRQIRDMSSSPLKSCEEWLHVLNFVPRKRSIFLAEVGLDRQVLVTFAGWESWFPRPGNCCRWLALPPPLLSQHERLHLTPCQYRDPRWWRRGKGIVGQRSAAGDISHVGWVEEGEKEQGDLSAHLQGKLEVFRTLPGPMRTELRYPPTTNLFSRSQPSRLSYLLASHLGEPGSIPGSVAPGFPRLGIVPDDTASRRVSSGIFRFPSPLHSSAATYSPHFTLSDLKTSMLRAVQISPHHWKYVSSKVLPILLSPCLVIRSGFELSLCGINWNWHALQQQPPNPVSLLTAPLVLHAFDSRRGPSRIFACGNSAGRFRWLAGFLPLSCLGVTPYSPRFTLIDSQDLDVNRRPNLSNPLHSNPFTADFSPVPFSLSNLLRLYSPFTITSNFSETLLKLYFQHIPPPHANKVQLRPARSGVVVKLLASHQVEPGSIPGGWPPDPRMWESLPDDAAGRLVFSGMSLFSPVLTFRRCSILTSLHPRQLSYLDVKSRPNRFTHTNLDFRRAAATDWSTTRVHCPCLLVMAVVLTWIVVQNSLQRHVLSQPCWWRSRVRSRSPAQGRGESRCLPACLTSFKVVSELVHRCMRSVNVRHLSSKCCGDVSCVDKAFTTQLPLHFGNKIVVTRTKIGPTPLPSATP